MGKYTTGIHPDVFEEYKERYRKFCQKEQLTAVRCAELRYQAHVITVQRASARFFHTYQTGINLQFNTLLKYFKVEFTENKERQSEIVEAVRKCDQIALKEELAIGVLKEIKRNMLQRMFP